MASSSTSLGVQPVLGRMFRADDDKRGGGPDGPVAVISHDFWRRRFGSARMSSANCLSWIPSHSRSSACRLPLSSGRTSASVSTLRFRSGRSHCCVGSIVHWGCRPATGSGSWSVLDLTRLLRPGLPRCVGSIRRFAMSSWLGPRRAARGRFQRAPYPEVCIAGTFGASRPIRPGPGGPLGHRRAGRPNRVCEHREPDAGARRGTAPRDECQDCDWCIAHPPRAHASGGGVVLAIIGTYSAAACRNG